MSDYVFHHYPPELLDLLVDAIPRLLKGKQNVLDFFKACGVPEDDYLALQSALRRDKSAISKFELVRQVLRTLNDLGDARLKQRREVVRRVAQWDDFSRSYENDRAEAEGFVARIQKLVNTKDAFTRMNNEREALAVAARQERERASLERKRIADEREKIRDRLAALFAATDPRARGTHLESVLNDLFRSFGISIREAFRRVGESGEGVVEQIDGVIELDGEIYLVEMKWHTPALGTDFVSQHLVRVFTRSAARGILISASGFTDPAIVIVRESLAKATFVLVEVSEIVQVLESGRSLADLLVAKVRAAVIDKNPLFRPPSKY